MNESKPQNANNSARKPTGIVNQQSLAPPPGVIIVDGGFFESQFTTSSQAPQSFHQNNASNPQLISMSDITLEHNFEDNDISKSSHHQNEQVGQINGGGFLDQVSVRKISGDNPKKPLQDNKWQLENSLKNNNQVASSSLILGVAANSVGESRDISHQILNEGSFNNDLAFNNPYPHANPQVVVKLLKEKSQSNESSNTSGFNIFSNSFDESGAALQLEMRPQRNCKSSTRKLNPSAASGAITNSGLPKTIGLNYMSNSGNIGANNKPFGSQQQHQIPLLQNLGGLNNSQIINAPLTAKLTGQQKNSEVQPARSTIIVTKKGSSAQILQNTVSQGHQKSSGPNNPSSFDSLRNDQIQISQSANISSHDLSNRSHLVQSSNHQQSSPYESQTKNQMIPQSYPAYQGLNQPSVILSDGGGPAVKRNQQNVQLSQQQQQLAQVDPLTFFKMKQQKYKSSRSNNPTAGAGYGLNSMTPAPFNNNPQGGVGNANYMSNHVSSGAGNQANLLQFQRQGSNSNIMNNSQQFVFSMNPQMLGANVGPQLPFKAQMQRNKGNKTQKNNKSMCSSGGGNVSIMNTSSTGFTGGKLIKSLDEVTQPGETINLRFSDRKAVDLNGINRFKSLKELDVSGNLLTQDIPELRQLQFLIKLNLSNNQILTMYPVPSKLEYLNLSYNKLKALSPEAVKSLKNLRCLEICGNMIETLQGIESMENLKRLLGKNNQITDVSPLNSLRNIIEIDLENNPTENYVKLLTMVSNKKDILVLNLRFTPLASSLSSYDQLCNEFETSCLMERPNLDTQESSKKSPQSSSTMIERFKKRLSYFDKGGVLYRSQRVFMKLQKAQHSKRSSSNFSNGSSSQGRVTGGRSKNQNGNTSAGNSFSPLLNTTSNLINTPNQHHHMQNSVTHRFEGVMQLYDNILEEEDRIKMKKKKKQNNEEGKRDDMSGESHDFEESMDLYGDEDDEGMHPFDEEDMDELQSYRNHHQELDDAANIDGHNEFLNESTADFGGVLKEINIKIRDELGSESIAQIEQQQPSLTVKPEHLQSFQSTQSLAYNNRSPGETGSQVNTLKKNPIFKLDLSKCTNNQLEDDDDEDDQLEQQFPTGTAFEDIQDQEGLFENVKVTDDSFRQFHKNNQQLNSQGLLSQITLSNPQPQFVNTQASQREQYQLSSKNQLLLSESSQQSTIRSQLPPKPEVEILPKQPKFKSNVIVPKLPLSILKQQEPIPLKQYSAQNSAEGPLNSKKQPALPSGKEKCNKETCRKYKQAFQELRAQYDQEKLKNALEITQLRGILTEIKEIFKYSSSRQDFLNLPQYLRNYKEATKEQNDRAFSEIQELNNRCEELQIWKNNQKDNSDAMFLKCQNNEKTISDLQFQIKSLMETHRTITAPSNDNNQEDIQQLVNQLMPNDIKRTLSAKYQQQAAQVNCLLNNPNYFYNSSSQNLLSGRISTNEADQSEMLSSKQPPTSTKTSKQYVLPVSSIEAIQNYQIPQVQLGTTTSRKKGGIQVSQNNEVNKKIKRPQSVVTGINQRRSSQGIKINNMLKIDTSAANIQVPINEYNQHQDDRSVGANEYCSNQELMPNFDLSSINALVNGIETKTTPLSQTMNGGKSGNIPYQIQKMKERNSSLQDRHRLNGSFRDNSGSHSAQQMIVQSPTPTQGMQQMALNLKQIHYQQDSISNNPYILSPNNHRYNESISSANPKTNHQLSQNYNTTSNQGYLNQAAAGLQQNYQSLQIMTTNLQPSQPQMTATPIYQNPQSTSALGKSLNLSTTSGCQLRKISYSKDNSNLLGAPNSTRRQSHYVASSSRDQQHAIPQTLMNRLVMASAAQNEYEVKHGGGAGQQQQSSNTKQHSKTQRIHVNRIQYNQMFGNKSGYNSSLTKQGGVVLSDQQPLTSTVTAPGYQTAHNQSSQQINLTQLFSGRLMMRSDSNEQQNYTAFYHSTNANQSAPNKHS